MVPRWAMLSQPLRHLAQPPTAGGTSTLSPIMTSCTASQMWLRVTDRSYLCPLPNIAPRPQRSAGAPAVPSSHPRETSPGPELFGLSGWAIGMELGPCLTRTQQCPIRIICSNSSSPFPSALQMCITRQLHRTEGFLSAYVTRQKTGVDLLTPMATRFSFPLRLRPRHSTPVPQRPRLRQHFDPPTLQPLQTPPPLTTPTTLLPRHQPHQRRFYT
mmetsp:Transcript_23714/g.39009  ORF Transcript_23714/g.39009 Transcript_23714/m.39009 type:complete len:215 (+) Transcript_23714:545-1189(+)